MKINLSKSKLNLLLHPTICVPMCWPWENICQLARDTQVKRMFSVNFFEHADSMALECIFICQLFSASSQEELIQGKSIRARQGKNGTRLTCSVGVIHLQAMG